MSVAVETILSTIEGINQRKVQNFIVKPSKNITPNFPIGIDSLALILKVKVDEIQPIIDEMITFGVLELVSEKPQVHSGRKGWKKVRLKE